MRVTILALTLNEIDGVQEILPEIVGEGFDLVIGSRYKGDAKSDDDELMTGFGNLLFRRL